MKTKRLMAKTSSRRRQGHWCQLDIFVHLEKQNLSNFTTKVSEKETDTKKIIAIHSKNRKLTRKEPACDRTIQTYKKHEMKQSHSARLLGNILFTPDDNEEWRNLFDKLSEDARNSLLFPRKSRGIHWQMLLRELTLPTCLLPRTAANSLKVGHRHFF